MTNSTASHVFYNRGTNCFVCLNCGGGTGQVPTNERRAEQKWQRFYAVHASCKRPEPPAEHPWATATVDDIWNDLCSNAKARPDVAAAMGFVPDDRMRKVFDRLCEPPAE